MPIKSLVVPCEMDECTGVVAVALLKPRGQAICAECLEQLAECERPFDAPQLPPMAEIIDLAAARRARRFQGLTPHEAAQLCERECHAAALRGMRVALRVARAIAAPPGREG